ncbi:hypothetical protein DEI92_15285 [Curtobacterium sp. MCBD17_034]|nr:hypothetical protein DEI92_15285 [Curtobacterium sp. MCBD17_034]PZM32972.1 hypothetical protein DEI90_15305 [Curtobacterium sp. MCBD17_031]
MRHCVPCHYAPTMQLSRSARRRRRAALQVVRFIWLSWSRQVRFVGLRWRRQLRDAPQQWRRQVSQPEPVRYALPWVAWARFWTRGLVWSGRASRSEYWWCIALEAGLAAIATLVVPWALPSLPGHWRFFVDPFGATTSPTASVLLVLDRATGTSESFGSGHSVAADPWDWALVLLVALTALPRWSMLVRRLHDVDRSGSWVLAVWIVPWLGALLVGLLVVGRPVARGARFDAVRPLGAGIGGRVARGVARVLRRARRQGRLGRV